MAVTKTTGGNDSAAATTSSGSLKVNLTSSSGRFIDNIIVDRSISIEDFKKAIFNTKVGLRPNRQRLSIVVDKNSSSSKGTLLEDQKSIVDYNLKDGDTVVVKDLGPQISWRTVFIIEYLGPLLIHQVFFFWRFNTNPSAMSFTQMYPLLFEPSLDMIIIRLAYSCITFHFLKREYESIFIHRFSSSTMPLSNLFRNSLHYFVLAGLLIGYNLYTPNFTSPNLSIVIVSLITFIMAEMGNFYSHIVLRDLRPAGSNSRGIPKGFGFDLVSCPNYTFEIIAWTSLSFMTGLWSMWIFTILGGYIMSVWALKKHRRYHKDFTDYPRSRKAIIPFIL